MDCSQCLEQQIQIITDCVELCKKNRSPQSFSNSQINKYGWRSGKNIGQKISLKKIQNSSLSQEKASPVGESIADLINWVILPAIPFSQNEAPKMKPNFQNSKSTMALSISSYASRVIFTKSPLQAPIYFNIPNQNNNTNGVIKIEQFIKAKQRTYQNIQAEVGSKCPQFLIKQSTTFNRSLQTVIPSIKINTCQYNKQETIPIKKISEQEIEAQFQKDLQRIIQQSVQKIQQQLDQQNGSVMEWQKEYKNLKEEETNEDYLKAPSENLKDIASSRISHVGSGVRNLQDIICTRTESIGGDSSQQSLSEIIMSANNMKNNMNTSGQLFFDEKLSQGTMSQKKSLSSPKRKLQGKKSFSQLL